VVRKWTTPKSRKQYLNTATFNSLTSDMKLKILIYWTPFYVLIYKS